MIDISQIRQDYLQSTLNIEDVASSPFDQFKSWFDLTVQSEQFYDPTAFTLSTCGNDYIPNSRVVLLKSYDENGFQFFTNYKSKKGNSISENPNVSMLFFWDKLERQIRITGKAQRITTAESDTYFNSRPYESRIGAIASLQSSELKSTIELEKRISDLKIKFPENPPRPQNWGGYIIEPQTFEFWQGRKSRLHDRIKYELINNLWTIKRLYP